jgi:hypothetical protein
LNGPYIGAQAFEKIPNGVLSTNFEVGTFFAIQNGADCLFFSSQLFYKN